MEFNEVVLHGKTRKYGFAVYPDVVMYDDTFAKPVQHLIFGDYINLLPARGQTEIILKNGWVKVRGRRENGWIRTTQVQKERTLEINFVDIGQGDGCHIVTPDDQQIIIDAGQEANMHRFLSWRFNLRNKKNSIDNIIAIITHPDQDHYKGFQYLFDSDQLSFSNIYHNGIVERANDQDSTFGSFTKIKNKKYLSGIIEDDAAMRKLLNDETKRYRKNYPKTLYKAISNPNNSGVKFTMLHRDKIFVPGFGKNKEISLEVLGPYGEKDKNGKICLKYFASNKGKTKNGHSVALILRIGKLKVFLGGDFNIEAENHLLERYTQKPVLQLKKKLEKEKDPVKIENFKNELTEIVKKGREIFSADIAKACHHGSHHFTTEFLQSINALATIISSGDNESYGHPRPDALGAFGKYGRGERPLIFSTELARSHKEVIKKPFQYIRSIKAYNNLIDKENDTNKKKKLQDKLDIILSKIERSVAVYGMINVRTDGEQVIICQKLEKARSAGVKWDIHELIYNKKKNEFEY